MMDDVDLLLMLGELRKFLEYAAVHPDLAWDEPCLFPAILKRTVVCRVSGKGSCFYLSRVF